MSAVLRLQQSFSSPAPPAGALAEVEELLKRKQKWASALRDVKDRIVFEQQATIDEEQRMKVTLAELRGEDRVVVRYVDNPNGSVDDIAGIQNARGNVLGMMPHPDRAFEAELGSADGALLFQSALASA